MGRIVGKDSGGSLKKMDNGTLKTSQSGLVRERIVPHLNDGVLFHSWTEDSFPVLQEVSLHVQGELLVFGKKGLPQPTTHF